MNLGIIVILISTFGYISNSLNWKYLNYKITHFLYYIGTFIHEMSHATLCVITGAKIEKIQVFSSQPQVIHRKSKIPFLGELLISFAPIVGGILFIFLVNHYLLGNYFTLPAISSWQKALIEPLLIILQINLFHWQTWVMIALFINAGAMLGPSVQDLRNIWPILILLVFVNYEPLAKYGLIALSFIIVNIIIQGILIFGLSLGKRFVLRKN